MKKSTLHIAKTARFSSVNETYSPIGNLHERISFRGMNIHWEFEAFRNAFGDLARPLTKQQKIENYEWSCCEAGEKPFHWTDEQWNQHLADVRSEQHTDKCEAKSWFN